MSLKYKLMEIFGGNQKKKICKKLTNPESVNDLPEWCGKNCYVEKKGGDENPVFVLKSKKKNIDKAILYIYGGMGILGPSKKQMKFACALAEKTGATVYFPFYPLAPTNNVRFSLRWLQKTYADILRDWSAKKVVFAGDGYGANLAMSLCYRVAGHPSKLVLISPALGLNNEWGLENRKSMEDKDKAMSVDADAIVATNWFKNVHLDSSDADPIFVDCVNFPPVQLFYGTKEIYAASEDKLISNIESKNVPLEVVKRNMCHDWAILQNTREGKKAVKQIALFLDKEFGPVQPKVEVPEED